MRLDQALTSPTADLLVQAGAHDTWAGFVAALAREPRIGLPAAVGVLAADVEERAGMARPPATPFAGPTVVSGQHAYVDYRLGMVAKIDALDRLDPTETAGVFGLVEYDAFASDRLISRTDLPAVARSAEARLTLRFHPGTRTHGPKDTRFVALPPPSALDRIRSDLRGAITLTARSLPGFDAAAARRRLDALWDDYRYAHRHARHAGEFNVLWTVRTLRRLGFRTPVLALGDLWDTPWMTEVMADTLVPLIQENERFVAAANQAVAESGPTDAGMSAREPGHVPLALTDRATGTRFGLRVERRDDGFTLVGTGDAPFTYDLGRAGREDLLEFLEFHRGRCTPNVFAPLFLFRAGVGGILNGRGAIRYSLVIARVMEQVFGRPHPPNFLCAGTLQATDPLAAAREADGRPPAGVEPTLLSRSLTVGPEQVRAEIAQVWR